MKKLFLAGCSLLILMAAILAGVLFQQAHSSVQAHPADSSGDWPTYMHDQSRTGANLDETAITAATASQLHLAWNFNTSGIVGASPTLVDGVMYIGSWNGYEYALDANTGQELWSSYLGVSQQKKKCYGSYGIGIDSTAAVQDGVVYVGGGDGNMYALNADTGAVIWSTMLGLPPYYNWSSPLLYNNTLYIGVAAYCDPPFVQGKIIALSMTDGSIVASTPLVPNGQTGAPLWGSATVDSNTNTIYIATGNNGSKPILKQPYAEAIVALDASTLQIEDQWQIPKSQQVHDSDFGTTPTLFTVNGVDYLGALNKNGIYYVFNLANPLSAGPVWEQSLSGNSENVEGDNVSPSCFNNGVIYTGSAGGNNNGQAFGGTVSAFEADNGTPLWSFETMGAMVSPVTCTSDLVIDNQGKTVEVRAASDGTVLFSYKTHGRLYGASLISNGFLYVPSSDDNVYAFNLPQ
jgi:outer membrane protein assembly factor BamB